MSSWSGLVDTFQFRKIRIVLPYGCGEDESGHNPPIRMRYTGRSENNFIIILKMKRKRRFGVYWTFHRSEQGNTVRSHRGPSTRAGVKAVQKFTGGSGGQDSVNFSRKMGCWKATLIFCFYFSRCMKTNSGKPRAGCRAGCIKDGSLLPQDQPPYCPIADEHSLGLT